MNTFTRLLLAFFATAVLGYGQAVVTSYSVTGVMTPPPGAIDYLKYSGSLAKSRQDPDTGTIYFRGTSAAGISQNSGGPFTTVGSSVYVYNQSGGLLTYNSDGEVACQEGNYTVYTIAQYNSSNAYAIPPSQRTLKVAWTKQGQIQVQAANVDMTYEIRDLTTNKVISSVKVPAYTAPTLNFTVGDGSDVSVMGYATNSDGTINPLVFQTIANGQLRRVDARVTAPSVNQVAIPELGSSVAAGSGSVTVGVATSEKLTGDTGAATNQAVASAANFQASQNKQAIADSTNQIVNKLNEVKAAVSSGGGGSGTDMTGTNSRLDTVNQNLSTANEKAERTATATEGIKNLLRPSETFDTSGALTSASSAATGAAAYDGPSVSSARASVSKATGGAPNLGTLTVGGSSVSFSFANFGSFEGAHDVLVYARGLILIALVVWLLRECGQDTSKFIIGLTSVNAQDSTTGVENMLPGISQTKIYAAAAAAVTVIVAAAAAMILAANSFASYYGVTVESLFANLDLTSLGAGIAILDTVVPVVPIIQILLFRAAFPYVLTPMFVAAASALKFIKI